MGTLEFLRENVGKFFMYAAVVSLKEIPLW